MKIHSVEPRTALVPPFLYIGQSNALSTVSLTSRGALSVCVGVQGRGSVLGSSIRGRGGVAIKVGVAGVSDWSILVGVAQGEP